MRFNRITCGAKLALLAVIALVPPCPWAQERAERTTRYRLFEIGTFGGPNSYYNGGQGIITNNGLVVGAANTTGTDPYAPVCLFDDACIVLHAFQWRRGTVVDLGALPGGDYSSWTNAVNSSGVTVGQSQNGELDPLTGLPAFVATIWNRGKIQNLGTFGGGFSIAISITEKGFVMGAAENGITDTSGFPGLGVSQIRGFGWDGGKIFDLGTLGGTSTFPSSMNNSGEIVGNSATSAVPGPFGAPPQAPFVWRKGKMQNLGNFGGQYGVGNAINERGEVVGASSLASQPFACQFYYDPSRPCHAFIWSRDHMEDLGTLGGTSSTAEEINNFGEVAGFSAISGDKIFHAFFWRRGTMVDLETIGPDNFSRAFGMNDKGQVVGQSWLFDGQNTTASHAFLWNGEGHIIDLNTLISNPTDLSLTEANDITDQGWIVANGILPNGDRRAAILVPERDLDTWDSRANARISASVNQH